ncbi:Hypothetical protein NTJ_01805 [Nesidiocoris tenuis]|uniref:Uncharacterized protein n=1 Tax=Nesidiocoris tenuis TaxID=355587 RepID=A0ABN7AAF7_9HEMI|nr:Hypothetical protein NTJ_01805 [Nesidiocoris tenuis]
MDWTEISCTLKNLPGLIRKKMEISGRAGGEDGGGGGSTGGTAPAPTPHASPMRPPLKKKESATFHLDGATYTIGKKTLPAQPLTLHPIIHCL